MTETRWSTPPEQAPPPRKSRKGTWITLGIVGGVLLIGGIGIASVDTGSDKVTNAPGKIAPPPKQAAERADLTRFVISDRSTSDFGVTVDDVWTEFTVTNHSTQKSDYTWDWEAVNKNGTRIDDGTELVNNVLPDQTIKDEDVTLLTHEQVRNGVKLHVTSFDRTASY